MIRKIEIHNIALIDKLEIDFAEGLTVLSGETGSGKSIIIDSLAFVLGERADKTLIKYGEEEASVSALFEVSDDSAVLDKLEEYGYGRDTEILVSRRMSVAGKNEIRVQGKTSTLAILKDICAELADIFGQGQHLALLNEKKQLEVLDSFCNFNGVDEKLKTELAPQLAKLNKQLKAYGGTDAERERLADVLKYQIDEITRAELDEAEEEELLAKHKRMVNAEKIAQALSQSVEVLDGTMGAIGQLATAESALRSISSVEENAESLNSRLESARLELSDVASTLTDLLDGLDFSTYEADRVESRLENIKTIKRKYGGTIAEALKFLQDAQTKYDDLVNATEKIQQLNDEKLDVLKQMYNLSTQKSHERKRTAEELAQRIMNELADLGMKGTNFQVQFNDQPSFEDYCKSPAANGFDEVVFLMSANVGEPLKPLSKVISGGEMSRFMLAVKNITAIAEKIPTMVFDEIDTGISGNMAQMVATKLANVSADKQNGFQCIVITHLPQIMAMSDNALFIEKVQQDGRTHTHVTPLADRSQRAAEVARLMGGVGQSAVVGANDLLDWSEQYKASRVL